MIGNTGAHPLCKDCKHGMNEGGPLNYVCTKTQDVVTGYSAPCSEARKEEHCGMAGKWFERRQNISAIVDQAPITTYLKDDGTIHHKRINQPIAENDKVRAYRPEDVNLDQWKKDNGSA